MTASRTHLSRRSLLAASSLAPLALPRLARAEGQGPLRIAALSPLTGAGGSYGPAMVKAIRAVVEEANKAGGILGRPVELVAEDDQTNPEAAVRAARKLIDVDRVAAICGVWASSVASAVAPLCWESGTFMMATAGADALTALPHRGFFARTQPNTTLQGRKFGEFALSQGAKKVVMLSPQTPFAQSQFDNIAAALKPAGGSAELLIYDDKKPSYRTEVQQVLRGRPDAIVLGGYLPDTTVLVKDLLRAGFTGTRIAFAYSVNQKLIDSVPADTVEGIFTIAPSPAEGSPAWKHMASIAGTDSPDPYSTQSYDQANLILLAMQAAGTATGTAIRDNLRKISQAPGGTRVGNITEGLAALKAGHSINYEGASGPCDFTENGDILDCQFRYEQVKSGKLTLLRIA
ncbi:ABC transporter substrate-binding protein [Roseomonas sp. USHLN139]|uniref:ABC transporter substrate-binding protein n=1 Tax=Roseomonas sp. USHLN139 TaxID=3081298 RepID=UPI003B026176